MMRLRLVTLALFVLLGFAGSVDAQNLGGITTAPIWHLRGGDISGQSDGASISSWTAHVGPTPTQPTSSRYPIYHATGPNSLPYVTFTTDTYQGLYTTSISNSTSSYSVFAVERLPDVSYQHWLIDSTNGRLIFAPVIGGTYGGWANPTETTTASSSAMDTGSWVIYEWELNSSGTGAFYVDGTLIGTNPYTALVMGGVTAIGQAEDGAQGSSSTPTGVGNVAEVALYNAVLNSSDRNSVGASLASKYGITASYTSGLTGGTITANTTTVSSITPQESTISGGTAPYSTQFSYSTSTNGTYTNIGSAVTGSSPVCGSAATGLAANTTYYFRAVTTDSEGSPVTITIPSTTTGTPLTTNAALAGGTITANTTTNSSIIPQEATITGGTPPYSTQFSYSATTNGTYTNIGSAVTGASPICGSAATGLSASTTYYFRAVTTDSEGSPVTITIPSSSTGTPLATSAGSGTGIAPNNSAFVYSPYNWYVTSSYSKTINPGAYWRIQINSSTTCVIGLSVGTGTPYSEAWARVDAGSWQEYVPSASGAQNWTLSMPSTTTATKHLVEFVMKSETETQDRWNSQTTALEFTGLTLDSGASVSQPATRKYRILLYGTSVSEGIRKNGSSGISNDTDRNDVVQDYSYNIGALLDAEVGVVAFGAQGVTAAGSGNVPALPSSYNYLWSGQSRTFSPVPDMVMFEEGANDGSNTVSSQMASIINGIGGFNGTANTYAGLNGTRFLIMGAFGDQDVSNFQAAVTSFGNSNVIFGSTTGFWNTADSSDGLHPYGYADLGGIGPDVAQLASPYLQNTTSGSKNRGRTLQ